MSMAAKKENNENENPRTQSGDITLNILFAIVSEPYFLVHFLTFFSYFSIRVCTCHLFGPEFSAHLIHREFQALVAFVTLAVVKVVKEETWDGFVADMLLFAKFGCLIIECAAFVVLLVIRCFLIPLPVTRFVTPGVTKLQTVGFFLVGIALIVDLNLSLWYMLTFLVIYTFTQQPAYMGLGAVIQLTPLQLETLLNEGGTSRFWLVEFRSLVSSTCIRTSRTLPELSITFANNHISFGVVDLGLFPNTAERFGISLGMPDQLPTFILFENNKEVTRFPEINSTAKAEDITKKRLCRHFELDKHLLDYISGK